VPQRTRALLAVTPLALLALVASITSDARAQEVWLPSTGVSPLEQRVVVAVGPDRVTTWSSLRFDAAAGPVGMVVPVASGASLDWASDAWIEALEVATAPRIFPPDGTSATCPGEEEPLSAFQVEGQTAHSITLVPLEAMILDDVPTVAVWADLYGLVLPPAVEAQLGALTGHHFAVMRYDAPPGFSVTPTLRVTTPGATPAMPLALTRASGQSLLATTWTFGAGRAAFVGATEATVNADGLAWNAAQGTSTYRELRELTLLALGAGGVIVEAAGHEPLAKSVSIADGTASIDAVVTTYASRAAAYGDASGDPAACALAMASALAGVLPVADVCPRGELAVVGPSVPCTETVGAGEADPEKLRCGPEADDLALALSGLQPANAWVTRTALLIADGKSGTTFPLGFPGGAAVTPLVEAASVDLSDCGPSSTSSTGSGRGAGTGSGSGYPTGGAETPHDTVYSETYVHTDLGCDCSGTADTYTTYDDGSDASYYDSSDTSSDSCDGDTASSGSESGDSCNGGSSSSSSESGDTCDGSSSSSGAESGDTCSGGSSSSSSGDSCDGGGSSGSSSSGCDSGGSSGSSGCSGGSSSGDCSVGGSRPRPPKLSILAFAAAALLAPLRRVTRRRPKNKR
jgi:hypothetical protein